MKTPLSPFHKDIAGGDLGYLIGLGVFYYLLIFFLEKRDLIRVMRKMFNQEKNVKRKAIELDDDVLNERRAVETTDPSQYTVRVHNLRKVFLLSKTHAVQAVDEISFGIKNGECFTLLGVCAFLTFSHFRPPIATT